MANRLNLTVGQVQPERTVQGKTGDFPVLDFLATNPEGKQFKYGMSKKELFQYVKTGAVIDAEITETPSKQTNPETGQPYINRNVVQVFVNGKPVIEQKGFQKGGGYQREDPTLRRRSYALSYAKDLCVASKIELTLIIPTAEVFDKWLSTVPSSTNEKQATASPEPQPDQFPPAREKSKPLDDLGIDMDWLRESLNKLSWTTAGKWLKDKYPNATGARVSEIVKSLTLEQRKEFAREVERRLGEIQ